MDLDKPQAFLTPEEQQRLAEDLARAQRFDGMIKVWVEDGHVFVERNSGEIISMTPEIAIELGRKLGRAGSDALVNRVMNNASKIPPARREDI